jgi:hypothetical protein
MSKLALVSILLLLQTLTAAQTHYSDGRALQAVVTCQPEEILKDGKCIQTCPAIDEIWNASLKACAKLCDCEKNEHFYKGKCEKCKPGQEWHEHDHKCVEICPENTKWDAIKKICYTPECPKDQYWDGKNCVSDCAKCEKGHFWDVAQKRCVTVCKPGEIFRDGGCHQISSGCKARDQCVVSQLTLLEIKIKEIALEEDHIRHESSPTEGKEPKPTDDKEPKVIAKSESEMESKIGKPRVLRQRRRLQAMADPKETENGEDEGPGSPPGQNPEESDDDHDHKDRIRYLNIQKQMIKIEIQKCYLKKCPNECGKGQVYDD